MLFDLQADVLFRSQFLNNKLIASPLLKGALLDQELVSLLDNLRQFTEEIQQSMDGLGNLVERIDATIDRVAALKPDCATTLVADNVLLSTAEASSGRRGPAVTLCLSIPGGVGLCVWLEGQPATDDAGRTQARDDRQYFVSFKQSPLLLRRLLLPNLEGLLGSLRLRIER